MAHHHKKSDNKKKTDYRAAWAEARALMWHHRKRLGIGLVLILISRLAALVPPASLKYLIDEVIGKGRHDLLLWLALGITIATALQTGSSFLITQLLSVAAQRAIADMRKTVQQHVLRLPVSFFDETKSGVLISRIMTDAEGIRNLVGTGVLHLVGGTITALFSLVVLLYLNAKLTFATLIAVIIFGGCMAYAFKMIRPLFRMRGELNAQVTGRLGEALGGVRLVKAYTSEKREDLVFARGAHKLFRNVAKTLVASAAVTSGTGLLMGLIYALMAWVGGNSIVDGTMTLGDFIAYLAFTAMLIAPVVQISSIGTQIAEAFAGLDRIRELRQLATEADEDVDREPIADIRGEINFEDVRFEYEEDRPVLRGVSFEAPAGTTTALVGSSGSGKSTLISLVMAFNRPQDGRITVDGRDLDRLRLYDYRAHLGIVMQESFLFDGSIAENISYGHPRASREEIVEAGRIAHCAHFVEDLPDGWDTIIGERGVKLSGGQRQRVSIARAILADPRILILDEATSSLDSESEAMIQDGLTALRRGRTTFVIAHRLSTIQSADQILVLEAGEIVERGTHEELIAKDGRYRELYDKQYRLERDRFINPGEDFTPEPEAD